MDGRRWRVLCATLPSTLLSLTLASRALVSFCTFGVVQSFGVYQDYYQVLTFPFTETLADRHPYLASLSQYPFALRDQLDRFSSSLLSLYSGAILWPSV